MTSAMVQNDTGWNEFFIPLEMINEDSIKITKVPKNSILGSEKFYDMIYLLKYSTSIFNLPYISIITPYMKIHSWDPTTGRLEFEIESGSFVYSKFTRLQELFFEYLIDNIKDLIKYNIHTKTELFNTFKQILYKNIFAVYLHGPNPLQKQKTGRVWTLNSSGWEKGVSTDTFKKGTYARVAFRFQGISHLETPNETFKKLKIRLRHQTVAIIQEPEKL